MRWEGTDELHLKTSASPCLTCHHAVEGDCALADEVLADGVVIPYEETHQGQLRHVDREHQSLLPHRVKPYRTIPRGRRKGWRRGTEGRGGEGSEGRTEEEGKDRRGEVRLINKEERKRWRTEIVDSPGWSQRASSALINYSGVCVSEKAD